MLKLSWAELISSDASQSSTLALGHQFLKTHTEEFRLYNFYRTTVRYDKIRVQLQLMDTHARTQDDKSERTLYAVYVRRRSCISLKMNPTAYNFYKTYKLSQLIEVAIVDD
jgi:hypothetical protein